MLMEVRVRIPKDVVGLLRKHKEIDFGEVAKNAIVKKAVEAEVADNIARKSKLTEADAEQIGILVKKGLRERYE
jgi:hypothetical protein